MRIKRLLYATGVVGGLFLGGCASDTPTDLSGAGSLMLRVAVDGSVTDAEPATRSSQADVIPSSEQMTVRLSKADGSYAETWNSLTEFPVDKQFATGMYSLEAFYGSIEQEGFESPYYYGVADVNVVEGSCSEVAVTASLANTMVSIDYTDAFRKYFTSYSVQVHSEGGDFISFMSDETRPAYVRPGKTTVTISVTKQNGLSASIEAADFESSPRHHYHITLDVNDGQTGEGVLKVMFDDSIVTEDVDIDISDSVLLMPAPQVTPTGFADSQAVSCDEGTPLGQAYMTVNAPGALRSVVLTTQSQNLISRGFPAEIDLMDATEAQQALLRSFGLDVKGLYNRPDKMAVIDFSQVPVHVQGAGEHSFAVVAKDKLGKVNMPVTLKLQTRAVQTRIASLPDIRIDQTAASMTVFYDGSDFARKATFQIQDNGTWENVNANIEAVGDNNYKVSFNVPAAHKDFPVRVSISGAVKATGTLHKGGVILSARSTDVWATHATFSVQKNEAQSLGSLTYFVSEDGSNFAQASAAAANSDGTVTLRGLTPGKSLYVKASDTGALDGAYKVCNVYTEQALQLPNADMETWYEKKGESNWSTWYPGSDENAAWGTNNPMTSSQGGNFAYCRISGTISSTDHSSGSLSAVIRTVGWGSGNTATGSTGGKCKYVDAGLLHLGPSRSVREDEYDATGIAFASRPSALTFSCKYSPKNSEDYGNVLVTVYDSDGNTIATGTKNITALNSFAGVTVPLEYSVLDRKAARIYVKFVSTVESRFLDKTQLNPPAFGGSFGKATWMGSQLYVDGLTLTY